MALMELLSVGLGWFGWKFREAERQRRAVEAIEKAGGWVSYDYEMDEDGLHTGRAESSAPAWLRKLLGEDFFADVVAVGFSVPSSSVYSEANTDVGDLGIEHLGALENLEWLNLSDTRVTDGGLQHLRGLTRLEVLWLSCAPITDDGLHDLKGLTELRTLRLSATQVTLLGLKHLRELPKLEELYLDGTQVTDEDIEELQAALPNCEIYR